MGREQRAKCHCPPYEPLPEELKMVMLGGGGVGKSALTIRFVVDQFMDEYDPTIEDNYRKQVIVDEKSHTFDILDTAGEEEFSAMLDQYIRQGRFFFLVFAITSRASFENQYIRQGRFFFLVFAITSRASFENDIPYRLQQIRRAKEDDYYSIMVVGNKMDLEEERQVSFEEALEYADGEGIPYVETSALNGEGVEEMYLDMVRYARDGKFPQQPARVKNIKKAR